MAIASLENALKCRLHLGVHAMVAGNPRDRAREIAGVRD